MYLVFFCLLILIYTCQSDIRKRNVSNIPWLVMTVVGVGLLVPGVVVFGISSLVQPLISIVSTLVVSYLFFGLGLFGAADAKCLISISVLFPVYPSFAILTQRFPLFNPTVPDIFPFALTTLVNSALLAMVIPISMCIRNLLDLGFNGFRQHLDTVFIGYRLPVTELTKRRHIKLIPPFREDNGKLKRIFALTGVEVDAEMIRKLEDYQKEGKLGSKVWVTPELPFMVFITFGFLATVFVGNLVLTLVIRS